MRTTGNETQQLFEAKVREGNLSYAGCINLVNMLLGNVPHADEAHLELGRYALNRAHEIKPYSAELLENMAGMLSSGSAGTTAQLISRERMQLQKFCGNRDKKRMAFSYIDKSEHEKACNYFRQSLSSDPEDVEGLFYLSELYWGQGNYSEARAILDKAEPLFLNGNPFSYYYWGRRAEIDFLNKDYGAAAECLERSTGFPGHTGFLNLHAETLLRLGRKDDAFGKWEHSLKIDPAQTPLYLKMHDLVNGIDCLSVESLDRYAITILMYTFNKVDLFRQTVEGLAGTDIGQAQIIMLDNNCTDGTKEFLQTAHNLFPHNSVKVINLPTNIGAPAARNWLLAQPENEDVDLIAYLDDDVILPEDWLKRLVASLEAHPQAAVAGAKVINQGSPRTVQYVYRYLDAVTDKKIKLTPHHGGEPDLGQFNFMRNCLSVMGCCHLFRQKALRDVGEFDVRFSPSQVDDIDHDILTAKKGYEVIYNGFIEVVHCQQAGKTAMKNRPAYGNVRGNDYKFALKHFTRDMFKLKSETEERDRLDIMNKISLLREGGYLQGVGEVPFNILS